MKSDTTLAFGSTFLVTDGTGSFSRAHDGFYHRDTRHLSRYEVRLESRPVSLLDLVDDTVGRRELYAADAEVEGARGVFLKREQTISDGFYEQITVTNTGHERLNDTLTVTVEAGFEDIFEVRGYTTGFERSPHAESLPNGVEFAYEPSEADADTYTSVHFDHSPSTITTSETDSTANGEFNFDLSLARGESTTLTVAITPERRGPDPSRAFTQAETAVQRRANLYDLPSTFERGMSDGARRVLRTSLQDLRRLTINTEYGPLFAAGTPWFATAFGRDSLIAAYQALSMSTEPAVGTLRYLAAHQATETDSFRAAEPGKIMHEIRGGELSARGEVPHSPYYGTIDATALFVVLLQATWKRTDDDSLVADLEGSLDAALRWLDDYGDRDDDGFLEYPTDEGENGGLTHQAWKDSNDGIVYPDGTHPDGPLAVAEAQGYYYDAKRRAADLYHEVLDDQDRAAELDAQATALAADFDDAFWLPDEAYYAVALDGQNEPIPSITTNPGHCLWSGIVPEDRADSVVDRLLAPDMFTGWGIRTLSADHEAYNPLSYHLGSVWPHDTSLVAHGMARYGRTADARRVAEGIYAAAIERGTDRLPELFAGFDRNTSCGPIPYGTACEPQAWAAGAPLLCRRLLDEGQDSKETTVTTEV